MSVKPKRNGSPQLDATFGVPWLEMPPPALAELSLTWVPVTVVLPRGPLLMPSPLPVAELPLTVQLASVVVPAIGPKAASGVQSIPCGDKTTQGPFVPSLSTA